MNKGEGKRRKRRRKGRKRWDRRKRENIRQNSLKMFKTKKVKKIN